VLARRALEQALSRAEWSELQLRNLVDNLPELAWNARPDGHIDFFNRRWYDYTGTTPEQMEGWGWQSVHDPERVSEVAERFRESLATGSPFEMEFPLRRHDGVYRWFARHRYRWFGKVDACRVPTPELRARFL